jgi:hypothetical protein
VARHRGRGTPQVPSPLQPEVESTLDVTNFDELWTKLPACDSPPCESACVLPEDPFKGYSYTRRSFDRHMRSSVG